MISSKAFFAVELCVYLANQDSGAYVTTTTLSHRLGLSVSHVENILKCLRERGMVSALKGPGGGYALLCDASDVSVWDIVCAFEDTPDTSHATEASKQLQLQLQLAQYELGLAQVVKNTLSSQTLADFVDASITRAVNNAPTWGRFKFKPMQPALMPRAPNSVFELHRHF
jgi:Rrf2 family protein